MSQPTPENPPPPPTPVNPPVSIKPSGPSVTGDDDGTAAAAIVLGTAWEGVLLVEGVPTGDGRQFALNAVTWPDPSTTVIPLRRNIEDSHGGEATTTTVLVGRITQIWRDTTNPAMIMGAGVFDDNGAQGAEALRLVQSGFLSGISVDPDDIANADVEYVYPEGDESDDILLDLFMMPDMTIFHAGRLRAATLVDIPAFVESKIWLTSDQPTTNNAMVASGWTKEAWNAGRAERRVTAQTAPLAYAHVGSDANTSKFLHHAVTEHLVGPANLAATAAGIRALRTNRADGLTRDERLTAYAHLAGHLRDAGYAVPPLEDDDVQPAGLTAALDSLVGPPAEWFKRAEPDGWQPLVVGEPDANGWRPFFGHGAGWGSCHTGFQGQCKQPPREGEHTYFRLGEVQASNGERIAVGSITMGTGHASTFRVTAARAIEHYDNTGTVVALVASSEGKHGIWLAGAIPPWVTAERVTQLQAAGQVSGDWRSIGGQLRLVAFLVVNTPGFPLPRLGVNPVSGKARVAMAHGRQTALVAAIGPTTEESRRAQLEAMAKRIHRDPASRAAELRARVRKS